MLPSHLHAHLLAARREELLRAARHTALVDEARAARPRAWGRALDAAATVLLAAGYRLRAHRARYQPLVLLSATPTIHDSHGHHAPRDAHDSPARHAA